jgi:hypothetical protein
MTISKPILNGLVWAGVLIVSSIVLKFAQHQHAITQDGAERGVQIIIGLTLAIYANFMTKQPAAHPASERGGRMQAALRRSAWQFCVAGVIYAVASAFAPHPWDEFIAIFAVGYAVTMTVVAFVLIGGRDA